MFHISLPLSCRHLLSQHMCVHRLELGDEVLAGKLFKCGEEACGYTGRSVAEVKQHYLSRHSEDRCYPCAVDECGYMGKTRVHLRRHLQSHRPPTKLFQCNRCDFKTRYSSHLTRHHATHQETDENFYYCPHCDYKCNIMVSLETLLRLLHVKSAQMQSVSPPNHGLDLDLD